MNTKDDLRKYFSALRTDIPLAEQRQAAIAAAENFLHIIPLRKTDVVSAYYPSNNEISPLPLLHELAGMGIPTALPRIAGKNSPLTFHIWQECDVLYEHPLFKIKEPAKTPEITPTIMIVPLLAFDKAGNRLGYGGGFYDRTIEHLKNITKITTVGFAYALQETDELKAELHDQVLDYVVTAGVK
jgi:5-formyltetrahydrofolate cyclo-ligase